MKTKSNSIIKRQEKEKSSILEQLRKTPIISVACERIGIPRATLYRWRKENEEFNDNVEFAIQEGSILINDMAESQLLSAIKDKNMSAIMFWLRSHHNAYKAKVEVTTKREDRELTPEEKELIKQAILLAKVERKDENERKFSN